MKKTILIITIIGLFLAGSIMAQQGKRSFKSFGRHHGMSKNQMHKQPYLGNSWDDILDNRKKLNLSDEQVEKIKNMKFEFSTGQVDRRADIAKAKIELRRLKADENASRESVMEAIDNLAIAKAELEKARYSYRMDYRSILTDEQFEKMKEFRKVRRNDNGLLGPKFKNRFERRGRSDI